MTTSSTGSANAGNGPASTTAPASAPDPFAVLGLPADPDLTDDDVRQAWQARLRTIHPDVGGTEAAVTAAYEQLRSAVRRAEILDQLDTQLEHPIPDTTATKTAPGTELLRGSDERSYAPSGGDRGTVGGVEPGVVWERVERSRDAWVGFCPAPERAAEGLGPPPVRATRLAARPRAPGGRAARHRLHRPPDDLPTWITLTVGGITWLAAAPRPDLAPKSPR